MQTKADGQLLRDYAWSGNEAAFQELVVRHTDLVYSSALRQVRSPDLARDVAQSVFTDLARKAPALAKSLHETGSVLGWLFRSTRFAALNQLRDERRRLARERQAMEQIDAASDTLSEWDGVRPVLDEAIGELRDEDREAVLLRFFNNEDFRAIGQALGVSEDAAQKRVSRALDRLRALLSRRGVTTTSALSATLCANAVQAAPAGVAAALATAATLGGASFASALTTTTQAIAMTTLQKTIIGAALAVAVGMGVYEASRNSRLRGQVQALQQERAVLTGRMEQLQRERDDAASRWAAVAGRNATAKPTPAELLKLRGEVTRLRAEAADPTGVAAKELLSRVEQLKQRLRQTPGAATPELQLLSEEDWLKIASGPLETDLHYRRALGELRQTAERHFQKILEPALRTYLASHNDQFPTDLAQLKPYFQSPVDEAMLQRWHIVPAKTIDAKVVDGEWVITQKSGVDDIFDLRIMIGATDAAGTAYFARESLMIPVWEAFTQANSNRRPADVSQLLPYATNSEQRAVIQKVMLMNSAYK